MAKKMTAQEFRLKFTGKLLSEGKSMKAASAAFEKKYGSVKRGTAKGEYAKLLGHKKSAAKKPAKKGAKKAAKRHAKRGAKKGAKRSARRAGVDAKTHGLHRHPTLVRLVGQYVFSGRIKAAGKGKGKGKAAKKGAKKGAKKAAAKKGAK